jgi:multidrug efflux pump subunit AcrA (membrane-fusion protein)
VAYAAEVAGRVTHKVADGRPGHYVEAGEFLLQIDPTNYELEVERLTVVIEQAEENLAEVDVDLANTQALVALAKEELELQAQNLKRMHGLMAKGAATDTRLDEARLQELASRNALRTLENQLGALRQRKNTLQAARKLAQTELRRAAVDVGRTNVSAPLSGTLVNVDVEEGDYVNAGDGLFTINDTQTMEVSCQLRIDELYWVWLHSGKFGMPAESKPLPVGAEATFEIPSLPVEVAFPFRGVEFVWSGVLSRYDGTGLDPATRTVPCRVRVDEPTDVRLNGNAASAAMVPPTLFSGMYVKVRIPIDASVPLLRVPLAAVRPRGEVWLVREDRLAVVPVEVARKENDRALLRVTREGPQVGEHVITSPLAAVEAGMPVCDLTAAEDEPHLGSGHIIGDQRAVGGRRSCGAARYDAALPHVAARREPRPLLPPSTQPMSFSGEGARPTMEDQP